MFKAKKYLKLKKSGGRYEFKGSNDAQLSTLYFFLEDFYYYSVIEFKKLINDPAVEDGGGNETHWEKEGDKIIITLDFLDNEKIYENAFETTTEELIRILDSWEELCKKMSEEILMIRQGRAVVLEGKN